MVALVYLYSCGAAPTLNVSDKMRITSDVFVSLDTFDGKVFLMSRTEELYTSTGHTLFTKVTEKGNELIVKYKYVEKCTICNTALSPAFSSYELYNVGDKDLLPITFKLRSRTCRGEINENGIVLDKEGIIRVE